MNDCTNIHYNQLITYFNSTNSPASYSESHKHGKRPLLGEGRTRNHWEPVSNSPIHWNHLPLSLSTDVVMSLTDLIAQLNSMSTTNAAIWMNISSIFDILFSWINGAHLAQSTMHTFLSINNYLDAPKIGRGKIWGFLTVIRKELRRSRTDRYKDMPAEHLTCYWSKLTSSTIPPLVLKMWE